MAEDARQALERLTRERGEDFANLSRVIGRNPAYLQQFVRRGSPRRLAEEDRRVLARYLRVDEAVLGGPSRERSGRGAVRVPRLDVRASAGPGALPDERGVGHLVLDARTARTLAGGGGALHAISVVGDSMEPTLSDGDDILVDRADGAARLRDGVYVIRRDDALSVKRIAAGGKGRVTLVSDNRLYPEVPDVPLSEVEIIGRVVWAGRRLR